MNTTDETQYCNCKNTGDIRVRCNPTNDALTWENCPAKIHSTLWFIQNDYENYKQYEQYDCVGSRTERNEIIIKIATQKKYLDESETNELLELLDEQDDVSCNYDCICCYEFVPACDEDNCRIVEGLICWDCVPEHFCENCEGYSTEIIKPNICGYYLCETCETERLKQNQ